MSFASGLVGQLGWGVETHGSHGTAVTVNKFAPVISEGINLEVNRAQGEGLHGSTNGVALLSRHVTTTRSVSGDFSVEGTATGLGTLWRAALGSTTTPAVLSGAAYEAVFTPGSQQAAGSSLTIQAGRPQTNGTVRPFTWNGCKVTGFEIGGNVTDPLNVSFSVDGWNEATGTALAAASFPANQYQFSGADLTVTLGGTASTGSGKVSVSGGTALAGVKGVTVSGTNSLASERFYANGGGIKAEQLVNGYREYTIELDMDFIDRTVLYDLFVANTTTTIQVAWQSPTAITGAHFPRLEVIVAAAKVTSGTVNLDGPDVLPQQITLTALSDGTNAPFQIRTVSTDTAL
jgi:hypothetical protein